jgi:hypothetical protein
MHKSLVQIRTDARTCTTTAKNCSPEPGNGWRTIIARRRERRSDCCSGIGNCPGSLPCFVSCRFMITGNFRIKINTAGVRLCRTVVPVAEISPSIGPEFIGVSYATPYVQKSEPPCAGLRRVWLYLFSSEPSPCSELHLTPCCKTVGES